MCYMSGICYCLLDCRCSSESDAHSMVTFLFFLNEVGESITIQTIHKSCVILLKRTQRPLLQPFRFEVCALGLGNVRGAS